MSLDEISMLATEMDAETAADEGSDIEILPAVKRLGDISSMDDYLRSYGKILGKKAIESLIPLHVPGKDDLPPFDDMVRKPFVPQQHVIASAVQMLDNVGSGFIVGEMGTGKTLIGMTTVHKHASRSVRKGGKGGRYRALVLCPDHLISKWCREIQDTIPDAIVGRFGPQTSEEDEAEKKKTKGKAKHKGGSRAVIRDVLALMDKRQGNRWGKPEGAEWYVLGRNQAKWLSDWIGLADDRKGYDGVEGPPCGRSEKLVKIELATDEQGRAICGPDGRQLTTKVFASTYKCPACGEIILDKKGVPMGAKALSAKGKTASQQRCKAKYLAPVHDPESKEVQGSDRISSSHRAFSVYADREPGSIVKFAGRSHEVRQCGEPLYAYTSKPYRWAPARIIQKKMKRLFTYLIVDEVHEQKSDESAQSMACGKLISSVNHVIALTGTIIGGYAHHLFPLMMRLTPKSLRSEGFEWGKDLAFAEVYGRIDRIITTKESGESSVGGNVKSMRRAKSGDTNERKAVRPGVMPTMFGRHMIGSSMFITLDKLADELPDLFEYIGGDFIPSGEDDDRDARAEAGWADVAVEMTPELAQEYKRVTNLLEMANKDLLQRGCMKLLGTYLWTATDYPDKPFGWAHDPEVVKSWKEFIDDATLEVGAETAAGYQMPHTLGFWNLPNNKKIDNFVGVCTPIDLPEDVVYPKEQRLIDICKQQKADGRQTWVYVQMTGKRNIQPRLKKLLEAEGLRVGVLRSGDVDPKEREEWIAANGRDFDVMISHPQLVSTGLDLFSKDPGGHNYSTLVFYETGYNLFTMRQAARRAWRIGQPLDCRVYYMYYKETMQHKAMQLMSRKMAAAQALEGEFSEDGLAAMAGEDNLQMAMAKNLAANIDDADIQRSWTKVKSGAKKPAKPAPKPAAKAPEPKPMSVPFPGKDGDRIDWPMPRPSDLAEVSDAMRSAFLKLAGDPEKKWKRSELGCVPVTVEKLVNLGLAERISGIDFISYRCKLSGKTLANTLIWLGLYPSGPGIYLPMGVVIASHPDKGLHYVRVINHQVLSKGVEFLPEDSFPHGNSIPLCATDVRLQDWTLVDASAEDRQALASLGLFPGKDARPVASKLDNLDLQAQAVAESLLEAAFHPVSPEAQRDFDAIKPDLARAQAGYGKPVADDEFEVPEAMLAASIAAQADEPEESETDSEEFADDFDADLTEEVLAKMFANMMANGAW